MQVNKKHLSRGAGEVVKNLEMCNWFFQLRLHNEFYFFYRVSDTTIDELVTEVMSGFLRQIASVVINEERERFEEEKRQAEKEK